MKITTPENAEKIPGLKARKMFTGEKAELIHLVLGPGECLPLHANPFDVVFYVLKGKGQLSIENESATLTIGDTVEVKANIQRGWANTGEEDLALLVVKIF